MSDRRDAEALFLNHLSSINRAVAMTSRKLRMWDLDAEDFAGWVSLRLIEDDYAVLRKFRFESPVEIFLSSVIAHLGQDYLRERFGRWRASAAAAKLGSTAVELERLVYRDGYGLDQAGEMLRTSGRTTLSDGALARLLAQLPTRAPLRPVQVVHSEPALHETPAAVRSDERIVAAEDFAWRSELAAALSRAMARITHEEQMIVQMYLRDGRSAQQVARALGIEQKSLYRQLPRLRATLRAHLERDGISARQVREILEQDELSLWRQLEQEEVSTPDVQAILEGEGVRDFSHPGILGPDGLPITSQELQHSEIITDVISANEKILQMVRSDPRSVYSLSPREFEELVAELLDREGYEIALTPPSKDGGFDMYAARKDRVGEFLFLVECKRYAPHHRVGVEIVRGLYGVVEMHKAHAGIVVTTSHFTKGAREFQRSVGYRLFLRDYLHLQQWLGVTILDPGQDTPSGLTG